MSDQRAGTATENHPASGTDPRIRCVLFDFDGPVCRLFAHHPAAGVAHRLLDALPQDVRDRVLADDPEAAHDPQRILGRVPAPFVPAIESLLAAEEERAAESALATPGAVELVRALSAEGISVAITTNNSVSAARRYLARPRVRLLHLFGEQGEHVYGRRPREPHLRKPHPDCLSRALRSTGHQPGEALMIGDTLDDYRAARQLEVRFLGYATSTRKKLPLSEADAYHVGQLPTTLREFDSLVQRLR